MKPTLLVLMAGSSDAFAHAGYSYPKNLVEIAGEPLLQHVLRGLAPLSARPDSRLVCVLRREENLRHHTGASIQLLEPRARLVEINGDTAGAACTALLAIEEVVPDEPLIVANGDQIIDADLAAAVSDFERRGLDGGIIVFKDIHPRWSFVKCSPDGQVIEAAEKRPISNLATAGLYYFRRGADFIEAVQQMILKGASVNDLFYICPAYNELILRQKKLGVFEIPRSAYRSLATPAGVADYAAHLAASPARPH